MVEPVSASVILAALAAGATAAAKDTASQVVKDAYAGFKTLLKRHFGGDAHAEQTLTEFEKDPKGWEKPLEKALTASGAAADIEVAAEAQRLLSVVRADQSSHGKYNVQLTGDVQGQVIGDNAQQTNTWGTPPPTRP